MNTKYKVTKEQIEAKIVNKTFTILPSGKVMICELTLRNGFTVRGEAAVVDPLNFIQEVGEEKSYQRAFDQCWQLEGYLMQERKYQDEQASEGC